jgi:hypothetical protein
MSFATINLCVASQQVFIVYFVINSVQKLLDTHLYFMLLTLPPFRNIRRSVGFYIFSLLFSVVLEDKIFNLKKKNWTVKFIVLNLSNC